MSRQKQNLFEKTFALLWTIGFPRLYSSVLHCHMIKDVSIQLHNEAVIYKQPRNWRRQLTEALCMSFWSTKSEQNDLYLQCYTIRYSIPTYIYLFSLIFIHTYEAFAFTEKLGNKYENNILPWVGKHQNPSSSIQKIPWSQYVRNTRNRVFNCLEKMK